MSRATQATREAERRRGLADAGALSREEMEQAELDRLRQQVASSEAEFRTRLQADRDARIAAERTLDEVVARYQTALAERGASSAEVEMLRRQVEDQSLALRTIQAREQASEASLESQIKSLESALANERSEGRLVHRAGPGGTAAGAAWKRCALLGSGRRTHSGPQCCTLRRGPPRRTRGPSLRSTENRGPDCFRAGDRVRPALPP